jgi:hypothetical protein
MNRVRIATVLAATALIAVAGGAAGPAARAVAASTLLSQGRPATASSAENAGTPAPAAVGGNAATGWSSAFSGPQWIQVDPGATATIDQILLRWEAAYATAFLFQVSTDVLADAVENWDLPYDLGATSAGRADIRARIGAGQTVPTTYGNALYPYGAGIQGW